MDYVTEKVSQQSYLRKWGIPEFYILDLNDLERMNLIQQIQQKGSLYKLPPRCHCQSFKQKHRPTHCNPCTCDPEAKPIIDILTKAYRTLFYYGELSERAKSLVSSSLVAIEDIITSELFGPNRKT